MKTQDLIVGTKYAIKGTPTHPSQPAILLDVTRPVEFAQTPGAALGQYSLQERSNGLKRYVMLCGDEAAFARAGDNFDASAFTVDQLLGQEQLADGLPSGMFLRCIAPIEIEEPYQEFAARRAWKTQMARERRETQERVKANRVARYEVVVETLAAHGVASRLDGHLGTVTFDLDAIEKLVAHLK